MIDTVNDRSKQCLEKVQRMHAALRHEEPDRVPMSDFFWGGFIQRWREELQLSEDADPYVHYDLDWIVTFPNMDPHIMEFDIIQEDDKEVLVITAEKIVPVIKQFNRYHAFPTSLENVKLATIYEGGYMMLEYGDTCCYDSAFFQVIVPLP